MNQAARPEPQRLAKRLANQLPCSRSDAERYIAGGWVRVDGRETGSIGPGMVVLLAFGKNDDVSLPGSKVWTAFLKKMVHLRIFPDEKGHFSRGLLDAGGGILLVSQFTLYADCRKGRRPSFSDAAPPEVAAGLYERFAADLATLCPALQQGIFGADMEVELCNWGPVTLCLDSDSLQAKG